MITAVHESWYDVRTRTYMYVDKFSPWEVTTLRRRDRVVCELLVVESLHKRKICRKVDMLWS
jgi:hypothetical protein